MSRRARRWLLLGLVMLAGLAALAAVSLPYLPLVHGTADDELERLVAWLKIEPGARIADLGAGDGTFAVALARHVGPSGHVYATEIDEERLAQIRRTAAEAGVSNLTVIKGGAARTNLPEGCCDALFSRNVYHHLTQAPSINADIFRALRPGGHLLVIDFAPGGMMDWLAPRQTEDRKGHGTPRDRVVREVTAAGFQLERKPEPWRGRLYAVLFVRP